MVNGRYGCFNRKPFVESYRIGDAPCGIRGVTIKTFGQKTCQFTLSKLGETDKRCHGCIHKVHPETKE